LIDDNADRDLGFRKAKVAPTAVHKRFDFCLKRGCTVIGASHDDKGSVGILARGCKARA
jgi:hypothetical protein